MNTRTVGLQSLSAGSDHQIVVGRYEDKGREPGCGEDLVDSQGRRELDCVIAAQSMALSKADCAIDTRTVSGDQFVLCVAVAQKHSYRRIPLGAGDTLRDAVLSCKRSGHFHQCNFADDKDVPCGRFGKRSDPRASGFRISPEE